MKANTPSVEMCFPFQQISKWDEFSEDPHPKLRAQIKLIFYYSTCISVWALGQLTLIPQGVLRTNRQTIMLMHKNDTDFSN